MIAHVPLLLWVLLFLYEFAAVTLRGVHYPNNSEVLLTDIAKGDNALLCLTENTQCCTVRGNLIGGPLGEWYFPNGSALSSNSGNSIYTKRNTGVVRLNRRNNAQSPTGVYRCEIPDASGNNQTTFIGVNTIGNQGNTSYKQSQVNFNLTGAPSIQSVLFEMTSATDAATPSFTLDCITAGGPVDFNDITWTRAGSSLPANHSLFQELDDGSTATYSNTLAVTGRETGQYSCQLQHSGNTTFMDITVEGICIH